MALYKISKVMFVELDFQLVPPKKSMKRLSLAVFAVRFVT